MVSKKHAIARLHRYQAKYQISSDHQELKQIPHRHRIGMVDVVSRRLQQRTTYFSNSHARDRFFIALFAPLPSWQRAPSCPHA
jgi:hypothetical protein